MTNWIKVMNSLPAHPKILTVGDRAAWLYVCGLCYSNEHLTDGHIPRSVLVVAAPGVKAPEKLAKALVDVGLWDEVSDGWQVHDYGDYQRTSTQVKETRRKDRERKAATESVRTSPSDSARNPSGIHTESDGSPDGPSRATRANPAQEEKREREEPPPAPPGENENARVITFGRAKVPNEQRILAEAILADFNEQAETGYGAYRGDGRASEDLKRILGAIRDSDPPLTLDEARRITAWRLRRSFWEGKPHTGVVFGPNVYAANRESARGGGRNGAKSSLELAAEIHGGAA